MRGTALVCAAMLLTVTTGCSRRKKQSVQTPPSVAAPVPLAPTPPKRPASGAAATPRAPSPRVEIVPIPPTPPLEPVISPAQRSTWSEEIASSLQKAEQNAAALGSRNLNGSQKRELARIQSFIRQAREAERVHDFITARTLAQRAYVLSQDLVNR
jgi:hypothetical protein